MKKEKIEINFVCSACGKEQEPDEQRSNENWKVFDTAKKCSCGGRFITKFVLKDGGRRSVGEGSPSRTANKAHRLKSIRKSLPSPRLSSG